MALGKSPGPSPSPSQGARLSQGIVAAPLPEEVTVLVFKDNHAARTFQIPLNWISKVGALLWICAVVTAVSGFLAIKYYRTAVRTDPTRVNDLEQELSDLRASYHGLESKLASAATATSVQPVPTVTVTAAAPSTSTAPVTASAPIPTVTVTVTATPAVAAPAPVAATSSGSAKPFLFSALPSAINGPLSPGTTIPISIQGGKAHWSDRKLHVRLGMQYNRNDKGSQQGRIVVLARGPETLLGYPEGVINNSSASNLIAPNHGEYFSMSRYREVKADFGPVLSPDNLTEVEVLIFNQAGQLMIYKKLTPEGASSFNEGAPKESAPSSSSSESAPTSEAPAASPEGATQ